MDQDGMAPTADDATRAAIVETIAHAGQSAGAGVPFANPKRSRAKARTAPKTEPTAAATIAAPQQEDITMDATNFTNAATDATAKVQGQTQAVIGQMNDRAKGAMEKGSKMIEEMSAFGKGNVEAIVESSKIAARGIEAMGQDAADYGRKSFEGMSTAARSMATVKSPTELLKMQGDFMRQMFDSMVAETSKTTETMLKLAGEVAQPLSNRVALAAEKMKVTA